MLGAWSFWGNAKTAGAAAVITANPAVATTYGSAGAGKGVVTEWGGTPKGKTAGMVSPKAFEVVRVAETILVTQFTDGVVWPAGSIFLDIDHRKKTEEAPAVVTSANTIDRKDILDAKGNDKYYIYAYIFNRKNGVQIGEKETTLLPLSVFLDAKLEKTAAPKTAVDVVESRGCCC